MVPVGHARRAQRNGEAGTPNRRQHATPTALYVLHAVDKIVSADGMVARNSEIIVGLGEARRDQCAQLFAPVCACRRFRKQNIR